jgi:hypothetical protein
VWHGGPLAGPTLALTASLLRGKHDLSDTIRAAPRAAMSLALAPQIDGDDTMMHPRPPLIVLVSLIAVGVGNVGVAAAADDTWSGSGTVRSTNVFVIRTPSGKIECDFVGDGAAINSGRELELTKLELLNCTVAGLRGTASFNGCVFVFGQPKDVGVPEDANGHESTITVRCPVGKAIKIEAAGCRVTMREQGPLSRIQVAAGQENKSPFDFDFAVTGVAGETSAGCPGGSKKFSAGEVSAEVEAGKSLELVS